MCNYVYTWEIHVRYACTCHFKRIADNSDRQAGEKREIKLLFPSNTGTLSSKFAINWSIKLHQTSNMSLQCEILTIDCVPCLVERKSEERMRDISYDRPQLLWQKHVKIIAPLTSSIEEYQTTSNWCRPILTFQVTPLSDWLNVILCEDNASHAASQLWLSL